MMWYAVQLSCEETGQDEMLLSGVRNVLQQLQAKGCIQRNYVIGSVNEQPLFTVQAEVEDESAGSSFIKLFKCMMKAYMDDKFIGILRMKKSKLKLPQTLQDNVVLAEIWHSFYAYTYELIIHELDRSRGDGHARMIRLMQLMMLSKGYNLHEHLMLGYPSPRANVELYLQSLREREFIKRHYDEVNAQLGAQIDAVIYDMKQNMNNEGMYVGNDKPLRLWSIACQQLVHAICMLIEAGLIAPITSSTGHRDKKYTAFQLLSKGLEPLMPLFHTGKKRQPMLEYLLICSLDRLDSRMDDHFSAYLSMSYPVASTMV